MLGRGSGAVKLALVAAPLCPESQTWKLCGGTCNASPQEPDYYCEGEGKLTCRECDVTDAMDIVWSASSVGSCLC